MGGHSGFAVLGPINTAVADAAVGYGNEKHVPFIVNVSTGAKVNELFAQSPQNYVFRLAANDVVQTELVVRQAIDVRLHRSPAILCDDTGYGKSGLENLLAALGRRGIKPVYVGSFKLKDTDMTSQLRAARAAGADVLFSYGIGPELAAVALSMRRAGNTDGPAIKAALEDLRKTYDGVTGKYVKPYSAKDHEGLKESHVLLGRVKNGRVVPSWAY
jgi:ABC-type branched-subunit amino acid transport system substrate-binding protein